MSVTVVALSETDGDMAVGHLHLAADRAQPFGNRRLPLIGDDGGVFCAAAVRGFEDSRIRISAFGSFDARSRTPEPVTRLYRRSTERRFFSPGSFASPALDHLRPVQAELLELRHALQHIDARVGDIGALQVQPPQLRQARQRRQAFIGHGDVRQIELVEVVRPARYWMPVSVIDVPRRYKLRQRLHSFRLAMPVVVEGDRVVQVEVRQRKPASEMPELRV